MDELSLWRKRWRRALRTAAVLRCLPYIRMVGLNGSLATGTFHAESDIDFFIITKPGHLVTGRVLSAVVVQLLGVRRHGRFVAGRVCLNRFATADFLEITPHNEYHARVFHNLLPLYAAGDTYRAYGGANQWMATEGYPVVAHQPVLTDTLGVRIMQGVGELILWPIAGPLEGWCRRWQLRRVAADARARYPGSIVVVSDQELRFHLTKEGYGA